MAIDDITAVFETVARGIDPDLRTVIDRAIRQGRERRSRRRGALAVAAVVAVAAVAGSAAAAARLAGHGSPGSSRPAVAGHPRHAHHAKPKTPGGPRPCAASALRVRFAPRIGLYTGHMAKTLAFVNRSGVACTLGGYPAVASVTAPGGRQVGAAASHGPGPVRRVTLAPGGQAWATVVLTNVGDFGPGSACAPRQAWGLRIYPPGQRTARYLALSIQVCTGPVHDFMWVSPVGPAS